MLSNRNYARICLIVFLSVSFLIVGVSSLIKAEQVERLYGGLNSPVGMGFDSEGNLFIAEWGAGQVLCIGPDGSRSIFADSLNGPSGLAVDSNDNIYVASYSDDVVYKFTPDGHRSLFVKDLATPAGLSFDRRGNLLIANRQADSVLSVNPKGRVKVLATNLQTPVGAVETSDGSYFVSNINGGVSLLNPGGRSRIINSELDRPGPGIVVNNDDEVYVVDYGGTTVNQIDSDGEIRSVIDGFISPAGLTIDKDGSLYVATWGDNSVYKIDITTDKR